MNSIISGRLAPLCVLLTVLIVGAPANTQAKGTFYWPAGTWYLALDAEPYGLPPGISLPGLITIHADRTLLVADGGDFGGLPFPTRDSAQFGSWRYTRHGIEAVTLFLQADAATNDVRAWVKVEMSLRWSDRDTLEGYVNVSELECLGPAPFPIFNCADPIASADDFVDLPPAEVHVTLRRLHAR